MRWVVATLGGVVLGVAIALAAASPVTAPSEPVFQRPRYTAQPLPTAAPTEIPRHARIGPFLVPVADATVPAEAELLPEAARDYRAGIHEGIDFPAPAGTPVHAAGAGRIVRIDADFTDWSAAERNAAFESAVLLGHTPDATLDRIRGRQVWIDHGNGILTRYAHLEGVAPLPLGAYVSAGEVVGSVGSSGYPEGGPHLHFEIRVGDSYLGNGLSPAELARELRNVFR